MFIDPEPTDEDEQIILNDLPVPEYEQDAVCDPLGSAFMCTETDSTSSSLNSSSESFEHPQSSESSDNSFLNVSESLSDNVRHASSSNNDSSSESGGSGVGVHSSSESEDDDIHSNQQFLYEGSKHTVDQAVSDVLGDYVKNSESKESLKDHLSTFIKYLPKANIMPKSVYMLLKYVQDLAPLHVQREHRYCKNCRILFKELNQLSCHLCSCDKFKKVYTFSIEDQIRHYFEHGNLKDIIDKQRQQNNLNDGKIRDISNGSEYLRVKTEGGYDLILLLNTDGVSISNSSDSEIWPILYVICEIPPQYRSSYLLVSGVWHDEVKPPMNVFMKPLVEELVELSNKRGVSWCKDGVQYRSEVRAPVICADAPARAYLLNVMNHNSKYSCNLCEQKSKRIPLTIEEQQKKAEGNKKIRRKRAFIFREEAARLRSDERMRNQAVKAHRQRKPVRGIRGPTIISCIPSLLLNTCVYPEYMHNACLGATRQFMDLWFNVAGPWNISQHIDEIDNFLNSISPPSYVGRLPRGVKHMKKWKASEFRAWLLFYSLPALQNFLPKEYFQHWMLLVEALFLLLKDEISHTDIKKAEAMLRMFVRDVGKLYLDQHYVYNIHCLIHLPLVVSRWSPLWATGAWQFENFNGVLKNLIHGTKNPA